MTEPRLENPSHAELRQAMSAAKAATDRVAELRRAVVEADEPREWSLSHDGVNDWTLEIFSEKDFVTCWARVTEIKGKILEAVHARPFDRSQHPFDVKARATCDLTGESVEVYVWIEQDEPECPGHERHDWVLMNDEQFDDSSPRARMLTEGCFNCECRKQTTWPDVAAPETEVRFDAGHYSEGTVARRRRAAG